MAGRRGDRFEKRKTLAEDWARYRAAALPGAARDSNLIQINGASERAMAVGSKKHRAKRPRNSEGKFGYRANLRARQRESQLAILKIMIDQNVRPNHRELADLLDDELRIGNTPVPDNVRDAIQRELRRESFRGRKEIPLQWFLEKQRDPVQEVERTTGKAAREAKKPKKIIESVLARCNVDRSQFYKMRVRESKYRAAAKAADE